MRLHTAQSTAKILAEVKFNALRGKNKKKKTQLFKTTNDSIELTIIIIHVINKIIK